MMRFTMFASEREMRPGAPTMAWIETPPLALTNMLRGEQSGQRTG